MKTIFKNKLLVASTLAVALFASYSCDDKDVFVFPEPVTAEKTMLEVMQEDDDFAQFLEVVELCGVGCADSLFNQSRVYSVFAPIEGSFNKEVIVERLANGEREGVFKEYVLSHISNFRCAANGEMNKDLLMLNNKYITFSGSPQKGYTFGGNKLVAANIQARNGIIHKISSVYDYKPSIWESLRSINSVGSFWDFCSSFTRKEFDPNNSILGDIVNQEQTYRDSAFYEINDMLNLMGSINNEDSLMLMYVPTNELWDEIYTSSAKFFNYNISEENGNTAKQCKEADSIAKIRGIKSYMQYLTYSMTDQKVGGVITDFDNLPDSLAVRQVSYPRKKYPTAGFSVVETYAMSNGMLNVVDAMPINPFNLWVDTIKVEPDTESQSGIFYNVRKDKDGNQVLNKNATYERISVSDKEKNPEVVGKLSNGQYMVALQADKKKVTELPNITFFIKNVLSTNYKIALITPPWFIKSYKDTLIKDTQVPQYADSYLRVRVRQNNELLAMIPSDSFNIGTSKTNFGVWEKHAIVPDRSRIDTIFLKDSNGEDYIFNFKNCEDFSGLTEMNIKEEDYTVEINIELLRPLQYNEKNGRYTAKNANNFAFRFLLDQIMLIPVDVTAEDESGDIEE